MQKSYMISCCAECPAFIKKNNSCKREGMIIKRDASNPVSLALIGFPEWCPLSDAEFAGGDFNVELKKIARQILKRLDVDFDDDLVVSIFHYLSEVVEVKNCKGAKERAEGGGLFDSPAA
jgi:hypothetical protein